MMRSLGAACGIVLVASCAAPAPDTPEARFLHRIEALADGNDLVDPAAVGQILQTQFTKDGPGIVNYQMPGAASAGCAGADDKRLLPVAVARAAYHPSPDFWFASRPEGDSVDVQNYIAGSAGKAGKPAFSYAVTQTRTCATGPAQPELLTEASIDFENVPAYICIDEDQFRSIVPRASFHLATNGASPYNYAGKVAERSGASAEFLYVFGTKCLLSARVDQNFRNSRQFIAASERRRGCVDGLSFHAADRSLLDNIDDPVGSCGVVENYLPGGRKF